MIKVISRPIIDINWIDLWTGKYNKKAVDESNKMFLKMQKMQKKKAIAMIANKEKDVDWKIHIAWLGWVN